MVGTAFNIMNGRIQLAGLRVRILKGMVLLDLVLEEYGVDSLFQEQTASLAGTCPVQGPWPVFK